MMGIGTSELYKSLNIPERTLMKRKTDGILTSDESGVTDRRIGLGKVVRLAQDTERAVEVFEGDLRS